MDGFIVIRYFSYFLNEYLVLTLVLITITTMITMITYDYVYTYFYFLHIFRKMIVWQLAAGSYIRSIENLYYEGGGGN